MAHRFIIDDQTGQLYKDFTGRRLTSAAEVLKAERGLAPTFEIYLINVASDTGVVTGQTLTNAQLSVAIGAASKPPETGLIKASWSVSGSLYESEQLKLENLTASAIESAFNASVYPVYIAGGLTVDEIGIGKYLLTMKKVGAIDGAPSINLENVDPPSGVEVTSIRTGDSDTKAQWIISISQLPVASIAGGSFSSVNQGSSFNGLSASIALNTTGMIAAVTRGQQDFEFSIVHNNQLLHRSQVKINESLDPTAAGTVIVTSPSIFTLGSNGVLQGETIALSGGLTYDGTTLNAPHLQLTGGTMSGAVAMGSQKITGLADGTASGDAINKGQLDGLIDNAPDALNTLNELAASLGNDVNFSTTVATNIATKLPLAGGTLTGDAVFNDGVKAKFGTHSDLTIQHTGSDSVISDSSGTGGIKIDTNYLQIRNAAGTESQAKFIENGAVELNYDNSKKLETTTDGILVTGTIQSSDAIKIEHATPVFELKDTSSGATTTFTLDGTSTTINNQGSSGNLIFSTQGTEAARFDSSGNLLVGSSNASRKLSVDSAQIITAKFESGSNTSRISFNDSNTTEDNYVGTGSDGDALTFYSGATEAARFNSSGQFTTANNVGIGNVTSPLYPLVVNSAGDGIKLDITDGVDANFRVTVNGAVTEIGPSTATAAFMAGGAERMRLNSTGLGIGGTPSEQLTNYSASGNVTTLTQVGGSGNADLQLKNNSGDRTIRATADKLWFIDNTDTRTDMVIDGIGNVGIGTTSPSHKLTLSDATSPGLKIIDTTNDVTLLAYSQNSDAHFGTYSNHPLIFDANSSEAMRILSGGQVIVGGTDYLYAGTDLTIGNNSDSQNGLNIVTSSTGDAYILFGDGTGAASYVGQIRYNHTDNFMAFNANGTEMMRLHSAGYLGIGTNSPSCLLNLNDGSNNQTHQLGFSYETGGSKVDAFTIGRNSSTGNLEFHSDINNHGFEFKHNGAGTQEFNILNMNCGIGTTSPSVNLHVEDSGSAQFKVGNGTQFVRLYSDADEATILADGSVPMRFYTSGTEKMRIATDGNVGIGTTSPGAELDLRGDMRLDSSGNTDRSIYFRNQSSLGQIKSDAGLQFQVGVSGSPAVAMTITEDDRNVGIGTSSPSAKLEIAGNTDEDSNFLIIRDKDPSSGSARPSVRFAKEDGTILGQLLALDGANQRLQFSGNNTEDNHLTVYNNGNIGISVTDPSEKLTIDSGNIQLTNGNYIIFDGPTPKQTKMRSYYDGSQTHLAMTVSNNTVLDLAADGDITQNYINYTNGSNYEALKISAESDHIKFNTSSIGSFASNNRSIKFHVGDTERLELDNSTVKVSGTLRADVLNTKANDANIIFRDTGMTRVGNSYNNPTVIKDAGAVGIGTAAPTANADLTLGGGELCMAETTTPTADANFGKVYCKSDNKLYFQDGAGTEHEIAFA